jgi:hypothetical protein
MKCRSVFVLGLLATIVVLSALAYASPPDPIWLTGIWDDDDADDIVVFIASAVALVEPLRPVSAHPVPIVLPCPTKVREIPVLHSASSSNPVRAPPTS